MNHRILIAEDESSLQMVLVDRLQSEGFETAVATDGSSAQALATDQGFDLILLDVAMPEKNGFDVCRDLRAAGISTPILMLTAKTQTFDKVLGLKIGADDYVTKPFEMEELLARIEALLRRTGSTITPAAGEAQRGVIERYGNLELDRLGAELKKDGEIVELSALEFKLLEHLVDHQGQVQSRDQLLDEVWGYEADVYTRTVDVHVASLRQKVEDNPKLPRHIVTVHGRGYKFVI